MNIVSVSRTIVPPGSLLPRTTHGDDVRISEDDVAAISPSHAANATHATHGALSRAPETQLVTTARNEAVDVVRLAAALGIVFVHSCQSAAMDPWRNMFRFAVPFYLFASLYFQ